MAKGIERFSAPPPGDEFDPTGEAQFRRLIEQFMENADYRVRDVGDDVESVESRVTTLEGKPDGFRAGAGGGLVWDGYTFNPHTNGVYTPVNTVNHAVADGELTVFPYIFGRDVTFDGAAANVVTSGTGNLRLVMYGSASGDDAKPGSLLWESSDLDVGTTGAKVETGAGVDVTAGDVYWFGMLVDTTSDPDITAYQATTFTSVDGLAYTVRGGDQTLDSVSEGGGGIGFTATGQGSSAPDPFPTMAIENVIPQMSFKVT